MAKRPRTSRWRRLPGVYRFHERKAPDPDREEQRISLFLPQGVLDSAAELAAREGSTVQEYCQRLLIRGVEGEQARTRLEEEESRRGKFEGLRAIADDPDYLAEWQAAADPISPRFVSEAGDETAAPDVGTLPIVWLGEDQVAPSTDDPTVTGPTQVVDTGPPSSHPAIAVVHRHAGLTDQEDPTGLLPSLRRGQGIGPASARELLLALEDLEVALRDAAFIERRLAYALHRLAFEGQVLLTDGWPSRAVDSATVDVLRLVQEGVDRVLSGEDIRYYPRDAAPEFSP